MLFWLESLVLGGSGPIIGIHPFTGLVFHPAGFLATLLISSQKKNIKKFRKPLFKWIWWGCRFSRWPLDSRSKNNWKTRSIHHSISNQFGPQTAITQELSSFRSSTVRTKSLKTSMREKLTCFEKVYVPGSVLCLQNTIRILKKREWNKSWLLTKQKQKCNYLVKTQELLREQPLKSFTSSLNHSLWCIDKETLICMVMRTVSEWKILQ